MTQLTDHRRKRLLYQATYRGFREADIIIGQFAAENLATMNDAELDQFEHLLSANDHALYAWIIGEARAPDDYQGSVLQALQEFSVPEAVLKITGHSEPKI
ncbi:MAG: FAD assembly factor SdhE [bacterium]